MAQTIKHRRGSVASVRNITSFGEAEIVIASGSIDSKVDGPIVYIGKPGGSTAANDYVPISKIYTGGGLPSMTPANFGTTLDGLPYYDSTNKKLYILGSHTDGTSGHTQISITSESMQNFNTVVSASAAAAGFGGSNFFVEIDSTNFKVNGKSLQITGSASTALDVSQSIKAHNINAGTPTSNAWQSNLDGSYFNNFNKDTDVSEILRFVAGLLSSSAANPTANSRTYSSISENKSNTTTGTAPAGYVPTSQNIDDITYLIASGFATVGGTLFPGKTIYTNTGYGISYTSVAGGSSTVESSNDSQLYGLGGLTSGGATQFDVKGTHTFKFFRTQTAISGDSQTEDSSSVNTLSQTSFGTSNGLTLAKINTVNPAVIPAAFQDGKFASVHSQNLVNWTTEALTSVSASGQYKIDTTIGIRSGSSPFLDKTASETIFWAPVSNIDTNIGLNSLSVSGVAASALTLTSGSLSGAPYISGGTWKLVGTVSGLFAPMYAASTTLVDVTIGSTSGYTISNTSGNDTLDTSAGEIETSGMVETVGGDAVNSGTPSRTDVTKVDATYTISGTGDTFVEARALNDSSYTLALKGRNRESTQSTLDTQTVNLHTAGTFGQAASSGSMGYFGGGTASTALIERFTNETYRRVISNSTSLVDAWNSSTTVLDLGNGGDFQVKPGYLVDPESANGYWYPTTGYDASHYKWYLREFETSAGNNKGTLTINLDPNSSDDLVAFSDTTSNKVSVGVIFSATNSKIYDAVKGNQSYGGSLNSQSTGANNPFSDSVDVVGDFSSISNSSGTLTLGLNNAGGQTINSANSKIWLLIRYKGTPSYTLEQITVSVS